MNDIGINILALCGVCAVLVAIYMAGGTAAFLGAAGVIALLYSFVASLHRKKRK